ncbi:SDR family NAD(P)-dependent oxidoreductase [Salinisphaera aquimarina]|uniref:SDR family NAD(P)-dependent oxidoreductase n=1 Tax=Salinisphaera aquimarina TaxID=2094031 RepID=A0ABV7EKT2_9GAMM
MSLEQKTALVTGAATGIGAAIAKDLAENGARVFGADIAWNANGGNTPGIEQIHCDVTDPSSVQRCVADIEARHGGVDILINNAALASGLTPKPFEEITAEEWARVMTTNTLAPFLCSQAVAPHMRKQQWGRIINLTSAVVFQAVPYNLHYFSSKGAIAVMTRSLARELGGDGITVNGIAPGMTVTEGIKNNSGYPHEMLSHIVDTRCIQREERAEDLSGTCVFLASEAAGFMTGQIVTVDGGMAFH